MNIHYQQIKEGLFNRSLVFAFEIKSSEYAPTKRAEKISEILHGVLCKFSVLSIPKCITPQTFVEDGKDIAPCCPSKVTDNLKGNITFVAQQQELKGQVNYLLLKFQLPQKPFSLSPQCMQAIVHKVDVLALSLTHYDLVLSAEPVAKSRKTSWHCIDETTLSANLTAELFPWTLSNQLNDSLPLLDSTGKQVSFDMFGSVFNNIVCCDFRPGTNGPLIMQQMLLSQMDEQSNIYIIDNGFVMNSFCKKFGGTSIDVKNYQGSLNGLYYVNSMEHFEIAFEFIKYLCCWQGAMTQAEEVILKEKITELIEQNNKLSFKSLYDSLGNYNLSNVDENDLKLKLTSYAIGGYAHYFNGKPNLNADLSLLAIELDGTIKTSGLTSIIFATSLLMFYLFSQSETQRKSVIVITEAWLSLEDKRLIPLLDLVTNSAHIHNTAIVTMTNNIVDASFCDSLEFINSRSAWRISGQNYGSNIDDAKEYGFINNYDYSIKLREQCFTRKAQNTNIVIETNNATGLFSVPHSIYLESIFSEEPRIINRVNEHLKKGGVISDLIGEVALGTTG